VGAATLLEDEDEALSRDDLPILAEDGLEGTGGIGSFAFVAEADLVGNATGFDCIFESDGHSDGVGGNGDGGIHQDRVGTELHGLGCVAGRTESGVHDDWY
jgi:hypothetical protein